MSETFYTNQLGKIKLLDPNSEKYSQDRQEWFADFEQRFRRENPELLEGVKIKVVGSVKKGLAREDSDIDITIRISNSTTTEAVIRQAIFSLLEKIKQEGQQVYELDVQPIGYDYLFNDVRRCLQGQTK